MPRLPGLKSIAVAMLFAVPAAAAAEVTVQSCGRTVTFDEVPKAAVSHDINLTETMLALGLRDRMVGYTGISGWNKLEPTIRAELDALPELAPKYPSKEVLVGAGADFYFAGWNYGMRVGGEVTPETLAPLGIQVYELTESCIHLGDKPKVSMEDMYNDIRNLGRIFGVEDRAEALIQDYREQLIEITEDIDRKDAPLRVFVYDSGEDAPFTAGRYAMPTALIEAAGGRNVMEDFDKSWGTVSWEEMIAQDPEIIVIVDYGAVSAEEKIAFLKSNPAFAEVDAIKNDRFVVLDYVDATPGPRNIGAVKTLAEAFETKAF